MIVLYLGQYIGIFYFPHWIYEGAKVRLIGLFISPGRPFYLHVVFTEKNKTKCFLNIGAIKLMDKAIFRLSLPSFQTSNPVFDISMHIGLIASFVNNNVRNEPFRFDFTS